MPPRQQRRAAKSSPFRTALSIRLRVALLAGSPDVACCAGRRPQQRGLDFSPIPPCSLAHVRRRRVRLHQSVARQPTPYHRMPDRAWHLTAPGMAACDQAASWDRQGHIGARSQGNNSCAFAIMQVPTACAAGPEIQIRSNMMKQVHWHACSGCLLQHATLKWHAPTSAPSHAPVPYLARPAAGRPRRWRRARQTTPRAPGGRHPLLRPAADCPPTLPPHT